jgi:Fe-Mn family superoxide dismutase
MRNALALGAAGLGLIGLAVALEHRRGSANAAALTLPPLPYPEDALVPAVSARTVKEHHGFHQAGYVRGYNTTMQTLREARQSNYEDATRISMVAPVWKNAMFQGGGAILHKLYWDNLRQKDAPIARPGPKTTAALRRDFGSVALALREIRDVALGLQGSGWVVLAYSPELGQTVVMPVGNHQNEVLVGARPLLVIDVWEHAYYLDRMGDRKAYVDALMPHIDWDVVERRLIAAKKI